MNRPEPTAKGHPGPMIPSTVRRDCLAFGVIGAAVAILGATLPISLRTRTLPSPEAWTVGLAPTLVVFGVLLIALSYAMYRGLRWVRWAVTLWFPAYYCTFAAVAAWSNLPLVALDWLEGLLMAAAWLGVTWYIFRGKEMKAHLSR